MPYIDPFRILWFYETGSFLMGEEDGSISVHHPDPRGIIDLAAFHIPMTLRKTIRARRFEIRVDTAFEAVIDGCAGRESTWITSDIREAYIEMYWEGNAHSIEAWRQDQLAGGLYGVAIGGAFFGESMFHTERDASKVALCALVGIMRAKGMELLDTQYVTPHLRIFGGIEIRDSVYMRRLKKALNSSAEFLPVPDDPFSTLEI